MSHYDSNLTERAVELYLETMRPVERYLATIRGKVDNERMIPQPNCHDSAYYEDAGIVVLRDAGRILRVFAVGPDEALTVVDISDYALLEISDHDLLELFRRVRRGR